MKFHWLEFFLGFWTCVWILSTAGIWIDSPNQKECQMNLPRSEKCVMIWVPESSQK